MNAALPLLVLLALGLPLSRAQILQSISASFNSGNQTLVLNQNGGVRLVLNESLPAFTLAPNTTCTDLVSCADYLAAGLANVREVNALGAPVQFRDAASVLNMSGTSWNVNTMTMGTPAVTVATANFTIPFVASPPMCAVNGTSNTLPVPTAGSGVYLEALLPSATTNITLDGQTVELLAGNVKWNVRVTDWPFCTASDSLVISFLLASANGAMPPTNATSQQLCTQFNDLHQQFLGNTSSDPSGPNGTFPQQAPGSMGPNPFGRRMQPGGGNGTGALPPFGGFPGNDPRRVNGTGAFPPRGFTGSSDNDTQHGNGAFSPAGGPQPGPGFGGPMRPVDAFDRNMYPPQVQQILQDVFLNNRPIAGLGQRNLSEPGIFLFFPPNNQTAGNVSIQAKVDIPATALVGGTWVNVTVMTPGNGRGGQAVDIVIPASKSIVYDPTATLSSDQQQVLSVVTNALQSTPNSTTTTTPSPPASSSGRATPMTYVTAVGSVLFLAFISM